MQFNTQFQAHYLSLSINLAMVQKVAHNSLKCWLNTSSAQHYFLSQYGGIAIHGRLQREKQSLNFYLDVHFFVECSWAVWSLHKLPFSWLWICGFCTQEVLARVQKAACAEHLLIFKGQGFRDVAQEEEELCIVHQPISEILHLLQVSPL